MIKSVAPGIILGKALASLGVFALLKGAWLALFFATFVIFSAPQMFFNKKSVPTRLVPSAGGLVVAGGVIGFCQAWWVPVVVSSACRPGLF